MKTTTNTEKDFSAESKLSAMGWNDFFQAHVNSSGIPARVIAVNKGLFQISDGDKCLQATLSGKVRYNTSLSNELYPVTGDWVLAHDTVITQVLPRRNALSRGAAGSRGRNNSTATGEQIIAANLDTVCIVCGLDRDYNIRRIERYLTLIYNCGLTPVIVLTKADLHDAPENCSTEIEQIAFGVPVHLVSAEDSTGLLELEQYLGQGKTVTMIGSSGAGKSTLLNRLYGRCIQTTGSVSQTVGKGKHTTTGRDLIFMPQGGMLIDNPGIREIAFYENDGGMGSTFADIEYLAQECRFSDCSHISEHGCNVLRAVENGELSQARLGSYYKMKRELAYLSDRQSKSADRVEKERRRDISLQIKAIYKTSRKRK